MYWDEVGLESVGDGAELRDGGGVGRGGLEGQKLSRSGSLGFRMLFLKFIEFSPDQKFTFTLHHVSLIPDFEKNYF
jgi:hypothetical protein